MTTRKQQRAVLRGIRKRIRRAVPSKNREHFDRKKFEDLWLLWYEQVRRCYGLGLLSAFGRDWMMDRVNVISDRYGIDDKYLGDGSTVRIFGDQWYNAKECPEIDLEKEVLHAPLHR